MAQSSTPFNAVWPSLIEICRSRNLNVEQMLYWRDYRDQATGAKRAKVIKQLREYGHSPADMAPVFRLSKNGIRNLIRKA